MKKDLSTVTTLGIGGTCQEFHQPNNEAELISLVKQLDQSGQKIAVIGEGSNIYFSDSAGFDGHVIQVCTKGNSYEFDACSGGMLTVSAGENWDELVQFTLSKGLANLESLSGIPGTVGAAPIQNIGAYGHEVSEVIARVRTYDRKENQIRTFTNSEIEFSYRTSLFKKNPNRYVILDVTFQLRKGENSLPIAYSELAKELKVELGDRVSTLHLREAVLKLRSNKGMLISSGYKTAGSFFTNPILPISFKSKLPAQTPTWEVAEGLKISAAWLIENSGFSKGYRKGNVGISPKHVLALINYEGGSSELNALANEIQLAVKEKFNVELTREVFEL